MPLICDSIGAATWLAMTSAVAPGIARGDAAPTAAPAPDTARSATPTSPRGRASTNRIEMTDDRIGRSMKKCVNMSATSWRRRSPSRGRPPRRGSTRRYDRHRLPRHDLQHAVDDDAITRVQGPCRITMSLSP